MTARCLCCAVRRRDTSLTGTAVTLAGGLLEDSGRYWLDTFRGTAAGTNGLKTHFTGV